MRVALTWARAVAFADVEPLHFGRVQLQILRDQEPRRQNGGATTQRNTFVLIADQHAARAVGFGFGNLHQRPRAGSVLAVQQTDQAANAILGAPAANGAATTA